MSDYCCRLSITACPASSLEYSFAFENENYYVDSTSPCSNNKDEVTLEDAYIIQMVSWSSQGISCFECKPSRGSQGNWEPSLCCSSPMFAFHLEAVSQLARFVRNLHS